MGERPKSWYPRYPADFIADTADLTLEEKGAYSALLDHHFLNDSIPADMSRLALILSISPQKTRKLWQVLSRFFHEKDGRFYQKRMVKEIAKAIDISEKRTAAAQKRWSANADAKGNASGMTATTTATTTKRIKEKRTARGSRLPADWQPSNELMKWAKDERPQIDLPRTIESFRDYWAAKTGSAATKLDWDATFRNWVRNERSNGTHKQAVRENGQQRRDRLAREALADAGLDP